MKNFKIKFQNQNFFLFLFTLILLSLFLSGCDFLKPEINNSQKLVTTISGLENQFGEPFGIAVYKGEIYVSDGERGRILRVSLDGKTQVVTDKLDTPSQIAFSERGDLLVSDSGSHTIKKVTREGKIELIAGVENKKGDRDGKATEALFNAPVGLAIAGEKIFVADTYNDRIRVIEKGSVTTLAGKEQGFADGENAKFNTPLGLAVWKDGRVLVADSENRRIRVIEPTGKTWTLAGNGNQNLVDGLLPETEMIQPTALVFDNNGSLYIADGNAIRVIGKRFIPMMETLSHSEQGFADGNRLRAKFNRPSGLAIGKDGTLFICDSANLMVRALSGQKIGQNNSVNEFDKIQTKAEEFRGISPPRWPYEPPQNTREIAGTLGEIRGKLIDEDSQAWFHNGLDIVGGYGEPAHFIRDEKVLRPNAVQNFNTTRELIRMPTLGYIHIRLGRNVRQEPFEDERFQFSIDEDKKLTGVRIPRGAKFKAGDLIGTLNTFNHVHLIAGRTAREMNALDALVLPGVTDSRIPKIVKITIFDEKWQEFETERSDQRIKLKGKVRIIVRAFDQMDGNADRRKLGLYKVGYQVLNENGEPLEEFKNPKWTIKFDKTPSPEAVKFVYARGSQSGATGQTIFNYIATNEVSGRFFKEGFLDTGKLAGGNYSLRVLVADFFGNIASEDIEFNNS